MKKKMRFGDCSLLVNRIEQLKGAEVAFMFGSAISAKQNGSGIAGVSEVVDLAGNFIKEKHGISQREDYIKHIDGYDGTEKYQETLSYINDVFRSEDVTSFIDYIIDENKDENGKQKIPQKIVDFIDLLNSKTLNCKNILTTNFDSIIETQIENVGTICNSLSIIADSNLNLYQNDNINIIHLHGIHSRGETMHESNQLTIKRDLLEASIRRMLATHEIYIIGYSGWDDSFTRTLANIVKDSEEKYSIVWCFYQNENDVIISKYSDIFEILEPAIARGLVRFFKNVDCNTLFEILKKKLI
ncbi:SIR2 family protein [Pectobacterium brasiliense]|uniref:SIR2 family protein n=1 Tax=Pectobacterium brasiliense TaxID=180957 RepID=UPI00069168FB|nr:SIR2 family protein [Pectobacterium brasiliense]